MSEVETVDRIREVGDECTIITPSQYKFRIVCVSVRQNPLEMKMHIFDGECIVGIIAYQSSYHMSWECNIPDRRLPSSTCGEVFHYIDEQYRCCDYTCLMKYLHYKLEE